MRKIVVFSGAGLSAESGIPTFRDSNGLWENHKVEEVAHPSGWAANKELVLKFYKQRWDSIKDAQPNAAHKAIAKLQDNFEVINLTQNIDDLLERAGCKNVKHFHGSINLKKCEWHKNATLLDGDRRYICDYAETQTVPIQLGDLCPKCGGQMRPDVVWFDEPVKFEFEIVREMVKEVKYNKGIFICVGTSGQVYPAASLIPLFAQVPEKYIVDPKPRRIGNYTLIEGTAAECLPLLINRLIDEDEIMKNVKKKVEACCNQNLKQLLLDLIDIFNANDLDYWLDWGALLGLVRNKELIKYDKDIDFGIFEHEIDKYNSLYRQIKLKGYRFYSIYPRKLLSKDDFIPRIHFDPSTTPHCHNVCACDIFVWKIEKDKAKLINIRNYEIYCDASYYKNKDVLEWEGRKIKIPNNVESYLELRYGKDWRVPDPEYYKKYKRVGSA